MQSPAALPFQARAPGPRLRGDDGRFLATWNPAVRHHVPSASRTCMGGPRPESRCFQRGRKARAASHRRPGRETSQDSSAPARDDARFHATWNRAVRRHVPRATSRISASHTRMAWPTIRIPLFPARAQGLCQAPVARQERFQDSNAPARGRRSVPCNMESGCETSRASCDVTHLGLAYTHGVAHDPNPAVPGEGAGPVPSPRRPGRKTSGDGSASSRGRRPVPRGTESGRGTSGAFGFSLLPAAARCRRRRWPACRPSAPPGCGW